MTPIETIIRTLPECEGRMRRDAAEMIVDALRDAGYAIVPLVVTNDDGTPKIFEEDGRSVFYVEVNP